ncbi:MAG: nickel pincer cofactor biosynthesis protein LarC [Thermoleophilaceae bacterium]|jgi:uncharacterized protein (TIGR00299 family) protein|nr:nickel pincer cofactor biosynthesis protein LarC [Thermoleophilaceae bacterium]MBA3838830.1 nickel pincer cofactor biosynthesis protein LarC [Thermoleophilaceae bacterium]
MSRLLYLDCVGGAAGDMVLGALLDAGASVERVRSGLAGLGVPGLELCVGRTTRQGIDAARVEVRAGAGQPHRRWRDVREMITGAGLPERAAERALEVFRRLAEAEGSVHGVPVDEVRFHEVGEADALAEVCGAALALEDLDVERVRCSPLALGRGTVEAAHGRLPLPAPAVLELLRGAPVHGSDAGAETVTPTGAALCVALSEGFGDIPPMRLEVVGNGAGARDRGPVPNLVRALVGEPLAAGDGGSEGRVSLLETNLDDVAGELLPDAAAASFAAGALDVWTTPVQMKKGRPGVVLSALVRPERERAVARAMVRETGTLGVRTTEVRRLELDREWRTVRVGGEAVRVKVGRLDGVQMSVAPEHEDCRRAAERTGRSVRTVWAEALAAASGDRKPGHDG